MELSGCIYMTIGRLMSGGKTEEKKSLDRYLLKLEESTTLPVSVKDQLMLAKCLMQLPALEDISGKVEDGGSSPAKLLKLLDQLFDAAAADVASCPTTDGWKKKLTARADFLQLAVMQWELSNAAATDQANEMRKLASTLDHIPEAAKTWTWDVGGHAREVFEPEAKVSATGQGYKELMISLANWAREARQLIRDWGEVALKVELRQHQLLHLPEDICPEDVKGHVRATAQVAKTLEEVRSYVMPFVAHLLVFAFACTCLFK